MTEENKQSFNLVRELEMMWDMVKTYALPNAENEAAYKALHAAISEYEVQRRVDAVVDAAVAWRQGYGDDWAEEADALDAAVDRLLELRDVPATPDTAHTERRRTMQLIGEIRKGCGVGGNTALDRLVMAIASIPLEDIRNDTQTDDKKTV